MFKDFNGDLDEWLQGYMGGDSYVTSSLLPMKPFFIFNVHLVSQVAAFLPALRAARVRVLEAIQYE